MSSTRNQRRRRARQRNAQLKRRLKRQMKLARKQEAERLSRIRRGLKGFRLMQGLGLRTRTRDSGDARTGNLLLGYLYWFAPGYTNSGPFYGTPLFQEAPSIMEYCLDELHSGPPYREGGPLRVTKRVVPKAEISSDNAYYSYPSGSYKYEGGFLPAVALSPNWDLAFTDQDISYIVDGTTGWNRFKPGRPGADLGVTLGEIRDVPRMLQTTAKGFLNSWKSLTRGKSRFSKHEASSQWLNANFGWLPFVNDCRKAYKTFLNVDRMIKQIIRDNNQFIRRKGTVRAVTSSDVVETDEEHTATTLCPNSYFYEDPTKTGHYQIVRHVTQKVTFSAQFKYHIPDIREWGFDANAEKHISPRLYARLFGVSITPSLLWELMPWSWLVDWVSNVGDVIGNMDSGLVENLVARYAYVTGRTEYVYAVNSYHNIATNPVYSTFLYTAKHTIRERATPFGFGLSGIDFSAKQLSILAALGESRLKWF